IVNRRSITNARRAFLAAPTRDGWQAAAIASIGVCLALVTMLVSAIGGISEARVLNITPRITAEAANTAANFVLRTSP
ncbi:hypothetical protein ABTM10_19990, partial [Acinetobacter baumannii]